MSGLFCFRLKHDKTKRIVWFWPTAAGRGSLFPTHSAFRSSTVRFHQIRDASVIEYSHKGEIINGFEIG
jgi:hypothetical protein